MVQSTKQTAHKACSCRSCKQAIKLNKELEERQLRHTENQKLRNLKLSAELDEPEMDRIEDVDVVRSISTLR